MEYKFEYKEPVVDGRKFQLIECHTWPYLNIQVLATTPAKFEADVKIVKERAMCGYIDTDRTFILMHAGGEGRVKITQANHTEVYEGMKAIMNAAVKWWSQNRHKYNEPHTAYRSDVTKQRPYEK